MARPLAPAPWDRPAEHLTARVRTVVPGTVDARSRRSVPVSGARARAAEIHVRRPRKPDMFFRMFFRQLYG